MSKPTGYIVRPRDMKNLERALNRISTNNGDVYDTARTLVGFAKSVDDLTDDGLCPACREWIVDPHAPQCPEDALNRIADLWDEIPLRPDTLRAVAAILHETGRLANESARLP